MQRRTVVAIAASITAAGAAVAFTLPSMAGETPSRGPDRTAATGGVAPQLLAAMKRDLGVDADRAKALTARAGWAAGVTKQLRTKAGSAWAGSWLAEDGTTLKVAVTDRSMAPAVKAAGAEPVLAERSSAQLDAAMRKLNAAATRADRALPGWFVDVKTNQLVLRALPGDTAKARKLAARAGLDADAFTVAETRQRPRTLAADVVGGQAYFINVGQGTARCSVGFAVEGGFVTAGHCGQVGDQTLDAEQQPQGEVAASVFPGAGDKGFVRTNADTALQPFVDDFEGGQLPVAGSEEAPIGAQICRSGSTTGLRCGTILAKNQTVNFAEGTVTGLTQTDACAEGGDSGGSWLVGDQAQGITSGGSGDCTVGGETFFQPVNEILEDNGLTLLTAAGQGDGGQGDGGQGDGGDQGDGGQGDGGDQGDGGAGDQGGNNGNGAGQGNGGVGQGNGVGNQGKGEAGDGGAGEADQGGRGGDLGELIPGLSG